MIKDLFPLSAFLVLCTTTSLSQTKIEKYCFLNCTGHMSKPRNTDIKLFYGQADSLFAFKDTTILQRLKQVESFHDYPDAFNYLGGLGWKLACPPFTPVGSLTNAYVIFCFRREFSSEELNPPAH